MTLSKEKITLALARKKMTVGNLAVAYGCSCSRMYVLLNSRTCIPKTAGKIAAALGVDVTEILEDKKEAYIKRKADSENQSQQKIVDDVINGINQKTLSTGKNPLLM